MKNPSEGYFLAKRQLADAIESRRVKLEMDQRLAGKMKDTKSFDDIGSKLEELETVRQYVRNVMLWDTSDGK